LIGPIPARTCFVGHATATRLGASGSPFPCAILGVPLLAEGFSFLLDWQGALFALFPAILLYCLLLRKSIRLSADRVEITLHLGRMLIRKTCVELDKEAHFEHCDYSMEGSDHRLYVVPSHGPPRLICSFDSDLNAIHVADLANRLVRGKGELPQMKQPSSPLRELMAEAGSVPFRPLCSLAEAQADPHGIAVFEGDDGGQVYLVSPANSIRCSESALQRLLVDLDEIEWPCNDDPSMRRIYFESRPSGEAVPGGMGGAEVRDEPWVHPRLIDKGLANAIVAVLSGKQETLR